MKQNSFLLILLLLVCSFLVVSCAPASPAAEEPETPAGTRTVMLSLFNDNNPWPIALAKDLRDAALARGYNFVLENAKGDPRRQYEHIQAIQPGEVDMLLLSPVDKEIGAECLQLCKEKDLPVILVARNADGLIGQDFIALISCDHELVGYSQGRSLVRAFGDRQCRIVELAGEPGASNTVSMSKGFQRAIENNKNFRIVATESTTTSTREALDVMEGIIQSQIEFDAIFCHSDADALGAIQALKTAGLTPGCDPDAGEIIITSNCGYEDAIKAVTIGELYNTFEMNARIGELVLNCTEKFWRGEPVTPRIQIAHREITLQNAKEWIGKGY